MIKLTLLALLISSGISDAVSYTETTRNGQKETKGYTSGSSVSRQQEREFLTSLQKTGETWSGASKQATMPSDASSISTASNINGRQQDQEADKSTQVFLGSKLRQNFIYSTSSSIGNERSDANQTICQRTQSSIGQKLEYCISKAFTLDGQDVYLFGVFGTESSNIFDQLVCFDDKKVLVKVMDKTLHGNGYYGIQFFINLGQHEAGESFTCLTPDGSNGFKFSIYKETI